jgi:curved DNA-binding protein CbpA
MNEINEAYEVLSNTSERAEYDKAFEGKYSSQIQTAINEENEWRSPSSSNKNKSDGTSLDGERELSWIVILVFFCLLFLAGITICTVRGQINLTGIFLSLLWAVLSFGVIFIGRAFLVLMVKFFKRQIRWKDLSGWAISGFAFLFFATVISGFLSYKILQMLLFGKLI